MRGAAVLGLAVLSFLVRGNQDLLDASIQTLAYVVMALGLNIVVGFAGLLDLGYVAFVAIGAYTAAYSHRASGPTPDPTGRAWRS